MRRSNFRNGYDPEIYWKTKDERLILLSEMTISHIQNAIAYFKRKNADEEYYRPLVKELEFRRFLSDTGEKEDQ